jgi:hydrogenase expression/formation protein HypC
MCYAIPAKILEINGDTARVDYGGVIKNTNVSLMDNVKEGEFVLIHAGFAIEKVSKKSAEESLKLINEFLKESENGR